MVKINFTPKTKVFVMGYIFLFIFILISLLLVYTMISYKVIHHSLNGQDLMIVYEKGDERCLTFGPPLRSTRQSCINLKNPQHLVFEYQQGIIEALYLNPNPKNVLIIGLGGGTLAKALQELLPELKLDIVELNPTMPEIAKQYFAFEPGPKTKIFIVDGDEFISEAINQQAKYDWIVLDAFSNEGIPSAFIKEEFIFKLRALLSSEGVLAVNVFETSLDYAQMLGFYKTVFNDCMDLKRGAENRILMARKSGPPTLEAWNEAAQKWSARFKELGIIE
jgi:spermidine synthase